VGSIVVPDPYETPVLTVEEAGKVLGVGRHAAYNAARNGEIPTIRLGRKLMVPTAKLLALLKLWPEDNEAQLLSDAWTDPRGEIRIGPGRTGPLGPQRRR
jgi:excisionase family DNA binding protein